MQVVASVGLAQRWYLFLKTDDRTPSLPDQKRRSVCMLFHPILGHADSDSKERKSVELGHQRQVQAWRAMKI